MLALRSGWVLLVQSHIPYGDRNEPDKSVYHCQSPLVLGACFPAIGRLYCLYTSVAPSYLIAKTHTFNAEYGQYSAEKNYLVKSIKTVSHTFAGRPKKRAATVGGALHEHGQVSATLF